MPRVTVRQSYLICFYLCLPMNISQNSIVPQDQIKFADEQCVMEGSAWDIFFFKSGLAQAGKHVCWVGKSLDLRRREPSVPFQLNH